MTNPVKFTVKDKGRVLANLLRRNVKFRKAVRTNFILAGDEFISQIRTRWYSGRKGGDVGLWKRTGFLSRSWVAMVREQGLDILGLVKNGAEYGIRHEKGISVKKRTFVEQDMKGKLGRKIYTDAIRTALKEY